MKINLFAGEVGCEYSLNNPGIAGFYAVFTLLYKLVKFTRPESTIADFIFWTGLYWLKIFTEMWTLLENSIDRKLLL